MVIAIFPFVLSYLIALTEMLERQVSGGWQQICYCNCIP